MPCAYLLTSLSVVVRVGDARLGHHLATELRFTEDSAMPVVDVERITAHERDTLSEIYRPCFGLVWASAHVRSEL